MKKQFVTGAAKLLGALKMIAAAFIGFASWSGMTATGSAVVIDFESGFTDLDPVGVVAVAGNLVIFGVGPAGGPTGPGFIAGIGGPETAFAIGDTPAGGVGGGFFLTDETSGPAAALDYFIAFQNPVTGLGLHLYDYRADGGPSVGDMATLNVYADLAGTILLGGDTFTIDGTELNGNVVSLNVLGVGNIRSAHLTMDAPDVGTGIDNIRFENARVPDAGMTLTFMIMALLGIVGFRSRTSRP